jgi:hypothetical protein
MILVNPLGLKPTAHVQRKHGPILTIRLHGVVLHKLSRGTILTSTKFIILKAFFKSGVCELS